MNDKRQLRQEYLARNLSVPIENREGFKTFIAKINFQNNIQYR